MAWETINPGNGGNGNGERVEREIVRYDFNLAFEGTFVDLLKEVDGKFGVYRPLLVDYSDGRKVMIRTNGLLTEALEEANLQPGNGLRVKVERAVSKSTGNVYKKPIVQVNRETGGTAPATEQAPAAPVAPAPAPAPAAPAASDDEELPF